jgi:hypothetical protein
MEKIELAKELYAKVIAHDGGIVSYLCAGNADRRKKKDSCLDVFRHIAKEYFGKDCMPLDLAKVLVGSIEQLTALESQSAEFQDFKLNALTALGDITETPTKIYQEYLMQDISL